MPIVSPSRYSSSATSTLNSLSSGSYRSSLNPTSSLEKPYYRSSSGTYVTSTLRTNYSDRTEFRSRFLDTDSKRERKTSLVEYSRSSRAPSVTESESGTSRYQSRSERSESRSRDISSTRSDSAKTSSEPLTRSPAVTAARKNVTNPSLLSTADFYNKYSPTNYVPLAQRLSTSVTGQNNSYGEISRSKSISNDIGRPPASDSRSIRKGRNSVAVPSVSEHRPIGKHYRSSSSSSGYKESSPTPSYHKKQQNGTKDTNGNDMPPSVAEIRKRFDPTMTVTKLPTNDSRYARTSMENYMNQLKSCQNGTTSYTIILPKDDKPVPVHLPSLDKVTKWEPDNLLTKTLSEPLSLAKPIEKNDASMPLINKIPSEKVPLAVKSQLDPNNPIGKILEKSTVIQVENGYPDKQNESQKSTPKHTSNFASYIQISRPIVSGATDTPKRIDSPKIDSESQKLSYIDEDKLILENDIDSPSALNAGFENKTFEHENYLMKRVNEENRSSVPNGEITMPNGIETDFKAVDEVDFAVNAKNDTDIFKPNRYNRLKTDNKNTENAKSRLDLKIGLDVNIVENGLTNGVDDVRPDDDDLKNIDDSDDMILQGSEDEDCGKRMDTSSESTTSDLTEDSSPETPQARKVSNDEDQSELAGGKCAASVTGTAQRRSSDRGTDSLATNGSLHGASKTSGLNGLRNIGNTCFMNSVLQCLSNTRPLLEYIAEDRLQINTTLSCMKGTLIKAFATVIKELWREGERDGVVNTTALKSQVQRFAPRFMGYSQQDAQEFLRYLLEGMHEDVNRVTVKPKPILTEIDDSLSDTAKAAEAWNRYLRMEESRVSEIFMGQLKSTLRCTHCHHDSVTFDPFWDLSLPIPTRTGTVKLQQCLAHFTREEELDGDEKPTCSKCGVRRKCLKWFTVQRFPRVLVLHLKRFSPMERFRGKLNVLVEFPLQGLDMSPYAATRGQESTYNLYAVSNHSGTTYSGHYTAYCKHPYNGEWHEYNDSRVSTISRSSVISSEAYVLFYEMSSASVASHL